MTIGEETSRGLFHPAGRFYRYGILVIVSLLTFGSYFAYDSIGAIAPILTQALGIDRETIGQTYTLYSIAAILSVFIGGLLIDKIGTRRASMLFSVLVTIGAAIVLGDLFSAGDPNLLLSRRALFLHDGSKGRNSLLHSV